MTCPYLNCGGTPAFHGLIGHCGRCREPVFRCLNCATSNRAFARHCRQCQSKIVCETSPLAELQSKDFSSESRRIEVHGSFWVRPLSRYGFLWCLSRGGEVLKVSPFGQRALSWGVLGVGFGASPFAISEMKTGLGKPVEPFLVAASPHSIKGISLINKRVQNFYSADPNESILSNTSEQYVGVEVEDEEVYFLKVRDEKKYLGVANVEGNREFLVEEPNVAGPIKVGSRMFVYSPKRLLVLRENTMVPLVDFEAVGFKPWTSPQETYFSPPFGRTPTLARGNTIYIPGERLGQLGLFFVSLNDTHLSFAFIPSNGESTFAQDDYDRPIIARSGEITVYEETASHSLAVDAQLIGRGQPYHRMPITIGFAKTASGVRSLRFFNNERLSDFSLIPIGTLFDIGFFTVAGAIVFVYQGQQDIGNLMRMVVWQS